MFERPPPPDTYQPPQAPLAMKQGYVRFGEALSREEGAARERSDLLSEERARNARKAAEGLARFLEAARRDNSFSCDLDKDSGRLLVRTHNSAGKVSSQPLMIGNVWDALAEGGIDIQPKASELVRFRISDEIEVAATVQLGGGFLGSLFGYRTIVLSSFEVRWLSLEERVADWYANLEGKTGILNVTYYDSNRTDIHEDKINVYGVLAKRGIKLQPKGSAVVRFALGADLMEATVELEVGFLGFSRKLKLLSVKRKRGEAWRLGTPEEETP